MVAVTNKAKNLTQAQFDISNFDEVGFDPWENKAKNLIGSIINKDKSAITRYAFDEAVFDTATFSLWENKQKNLS